MLALGCTKVQIGLLSSLGLALQTVFSLISGYVTDRLGRRRTTLIFDLVSWSVPTLILAFAQNFYFFLAAAAVNSLVRIVANSWTCLMIEDAHPHERVHIFTWISVAGILAGFFAPLAGLFVKGFGMVPAMRGLYVFAFVSMTFMNFLRNTMVTETRVGREKMAESRHGDAGETLREYGRIFSHLAQSPLTILAFLISILINIAMVLRGTFLSILLTKTLGFPEATIAVFPFVQSGVMLFVLIFIMPSVSRRTAFWPLSMGILFIAAGALILVVSPPQSLAAVIVSTVLSGIGTALAVPLADTLTANTVKEKDRAKVMSLFYGVSFALTAPFGYLGGVLSMISDRLPFVVAIAAVLAAAALAAVTSRVRHGSASAAAS